MAAGQEFGSASRILHTVARLYEGVVIHRQIVICYGGICVFLSRAKAFLFSVKNN
jgi:hypothetical protein